MTAAVKTRRRQDQGLAFLNRFVELFEEMLHHEGYGDMQVSVRNRNPGEKEVVLHCGKEYRYRLLIASGDQDAASQRQLYRVSKASSQPAERRDGWQRCGEERRKGDRRQSRGPWNFRLERRMGGDRRQKDRRKS